MWTWTCWRVTTHFKMTLILWMVFIVTWQCPSPVACPSGGCLFREESLGLFVFLSKMTLLGLQVEIVLCLLLETGQTGWEQKRLNKVSKSSKSRQVDYGEEEHGETELQTLQLSLKTRTTMHSLTSRTEWNHALQELRDIAKTGSWCTSIRKWPTGCFVKASHSYEHSVRYSVPSLRKAGVLWISLTRCDSPVCVVCVWETSLCYHQPGEKMSGFTFQTPSNSHRPVH